MWSCDACTFINEIEQSVCVICDNPRKLSQVHFSEQAACAYDDDYDDQWELASGPALLSEQEWETSVIQKQQKQQKLPFSASSVSDNWTCAACSFINAAHQPECEICDTVHFTTNTLAIPLPPPSSPYSGISRCRDQSTAYSHAPTLIDFRWLQRIVLPDTNNSHSVSAWLQVLKGNGLETLDDLMMLADEDWLALSPGLPPRVVSRIRSGINTNTNTNPFQSSDDGHDDDDDDIPALVPAAIIPSKSAHVTGKQFVSPTRYEGKGRAYTQITQHSA